MPEMLSGETNEHGLVKLPVGPDNEVPRLGIIQQAAGQPSGHHLVSVTELVAMRHRVRLGRGLRQLTGDPAIERLAIALAVRVELDDDRPVRLALS